MLGIVAVFVFPMLMALSPLQIYWKVQAAINQLPAAPYIVFTFANSSTTFIPEEQLPANSNQEPPDISRPIGPPNQIAPEENQPPPEPPQTVFKHGEVLRTLVRLSDGAAIVVALRDQSGAEIPRPEARVVTTEINYLAVSNVVRLGDFPLSDFGLRYGTPSRAGFFEAPYPSPQASALRVIATVYAFETPPYRIVDLGDTTIDGRAVYHLGLDPTREPARNVLRQMWIDKESFLPARYVAWRTVLTPFEHFSYVVTVNCAVIDGHLVNMDAIGTNDHGQGKWRISDVSFPDSEPDWVFDPSQWNAHHGQPIPNLAPSSQAASGSHR
jgi:hypothetical protein